MLDLDADRVNDPAKLLYGDETSIRLILTHGRGCTVFD